MRAVRPRPAPRTPCPAGPPGAATLPLPPAQDARHPGRPFPQEPARGAHLAFFTRSCRPPLPGHGAPPRTLRPHTARQGGTPAAGPGTGRAEPAARNRNVHIL
ncbi:hypothetical protein SUDANB13_06372 [Streptomyces sp. enrichment culture]